MKFSPLMKLKKSSPLFTRYKNAENLFLMEQCMIKQRRLILKSSVASGAVAIAASAGLLAPQAVLAEISRDAFMAKSYDDAVSASVDGTPVESTEIQIKAPDIAENGAVVPIKVSTDLNNVESISLYASNNPNPLTSVYSFGQGAIPFVATRIKMGKTGDVVAIVKADGKLFLAKKEVKVTIGGCGG
jgi:sulfur-oxidizing protein SoxY